MDNLFYRNRRLLVLAIALIAVAGLSSYFILPRLEDPELRPRAAIVTTRFPGANAERVELLVTERIEKSLEEIDELRLTRSASRNEFSTITMEIADFVSGDLDEVWSRVRDKVSDAAPLLPEGASTPLFEGMKFKAYAMLVGLKWTHPSKTNHAILRRTAEQLEDKLRNVFGTEDVDLFGDPQEEISIELDHQRISALGLTPADVAAAINQSDAKISAGGLRSSTNEIVVEVQSEFESLETILETPIRGAGDTIRLSDIATIHKGIRNPLSTQAIVEGRDAIVLGAFVQSHLRIDQWNDRTIKVLDDFEANLPDGIELDRMFFQTDYVRARFSDLLSNLGLGAIAVTLVIFLMMGWRSAIVVGLALPFAGAMVLAGLRVFEVPMHQMSVTGLIIALGLLIDNAIVIVDEVRNRLRDGLPVAEAISASVRHLAVPLFGSTFTTALAFAPLILMPGPAGEFVGAIGLSVILAVVSSLFISLTIIPSIYGLIERVESLHGNGAWWQRGIGAEWLFAGYQKTLHFVFTYPVVAIAIGLILPIAGFVQMSTLPEQFFPASDRDQIKMTLVLPAQAPISQTAEAVKQAREIALKYPEVERVDWFVGETAPAFYYNMLPLRKDQPNYAQAFVQLKSDQGVSDVVNRLQAEIEQLVTQATVLVQKLEQGPPVDAPILIRIYGNDLKTLGILGEEVRLLVSQVPGVVANQCESSNVNSKYLLDVDQEEARRVELTHSSIASQLSTSLDGMIGGSLLEGTEELPVRIKLKHSQRTDPQHLASMEIMARDSMGAVSRVPVSAIGEWDLVPNDAVIERLNGFRFTEIQVNVEAGVLPSVVAERFREHLKEAGFELPAGYKLNVAGESEERDRAVNNLLASAGILAVLMSAALVLSFQSFRIAAQIGVVAILSVGIGFSALWFFGKPFGFTAIVGIMGLVGVAINDSIVVLAALQENEKAKRGEVAAVSSVVFQSTRHVLSTTLTTIAGFVPLILSGGGFWPPLAIAIAGGVTGATILALYFVPATYMLMMRFKFGASPSEHSKEATEPSLVAQT